MGGREHQTNPEWYICPSELDTDTRAYSSKAFPGNSEHIQVNLDSGINVIDYGNPYKGRVDLGTRGRRSPFLL